MKSSILTESLLTGAEMKDLDAWTIAQGTPSMKLMERAGRAVAEFIVQHYPPCPVLVICGPGNNGGDGQIVARELSERGWNVDCVMAAQWKPDVLADIKLIVDALFGIGLNKPLGGIFVDTIETVNRSGVPVVSVDIPSGIDADSGEVLGGAIHATYTITFHRPKLGHKLLPGKVHAGILEVVDIGIQTPEHFAPTHCLNHPRLWQNALPAPSIEQHKYQRGQALVWGGIAEMAGAARLSALAALRSGAGLARILCQPETLELYAGKQTSLLSSAIHTAQDLENILADERPYACVIGPGASINHRTQAALVAMLATKHPCVIDADGLSVLAKAPELHLLLHVACVLTPHEGEFSRLGNFTGSKPERARQAAKHFGCTVVLKGNDTVIAQPEGITVINDNAPAWLATAGSGDVLAGIICGLMAQGVSAFDAACAGVWMHGEAARRFGPGLIADDIVSGLPAVISELYEQH